MVIDVESEKVIRCHPGAAVWPSGLTGAEDPDEAPEHPDSLIETHRQDLSESTAVLYRVPLSKGSA